MSTISPHTMPLSAQSTYLFQVFPSILPSFALHTYLSCSNSPSETVQTFLNPSFSKNTAQVILAGKSHPQPLSCHSKKCHCLHRFLYDISLSLGSSATPPLIYITLQKTSPLPPLRGANDAPHISFVSAWKRRYVFISVNTL